MSKLINENCIVFDMEGSKKGYHKNPVRGVVQGGKNHGHRGILSGCTGKGSDYPNLCGFDMGSPHGKTDHVLEASVCFGRTKEPVVWNEESGETADLIISSQCP